ncbi:MAG: DNA recombination protein RmuC [Patescibacteria group bacterium]
MENTFILVVVALLAGGGLVFLFSKFRPVETKKDDDKMLMMLNENLNSVTKNMMEQINEMRRQVDTRLRENAEAFQSSNKTIGDRLDNAAKVVTTVTDKLGKMEEANKRIYDIGKDISSLQEILRSPKLRGNLGEEFLLDLLDSLLPKEMYAMQYVFKNGKKVDAIVRFKDYVIPIDAKFPLENFQKFAAAQDEKEKKVFKKAFMSDVKKRIDEAAQYIMPDEGTLDFVLLYIPAENVYYEVIIKDEDNTDLRGYALKKRVIPVSPNNLFVYLQTVRMGLQGMQIEKGAREILATLTRLKGDFQKFGEDFSVLGSHIGNASRKYDESERRLERVGSKLDQIESLVPDSDETVQPLLT